MPSTDHRIKMLSGEMEHAGLTSLLISGEANVTYLSGFSGEASSLLITPNHAVMITDYRYEERVRQECPQLDLEVRDRNLENLGQCLARLLGAAKASGLGFESGLISHALYEELAQSLGAENLRPTGGLVEGLRMIKQPGEVEALRRAANLGDAAFEYILGRLAPGRSELELAFELDQFLRKQSKEDIAFATILISGPKTAQPHGVPGERRLRAGDFITMDFGARRQGYCSDMTRTVALGSTDERQREVYQAVLDAQTAAVRAARPGIKASGLNQVAREVIAQAGYLDYTGDGLGHGIGLQVHEQPYMRAACRERLAAGMAVTIEPGIYIPGWGGVRIEDTVLIKEQGCEALTHSPKELLTL
jgi:Xaa-Pro aminopeptidase